MSSDLAQITELFKNALVYTTIIRNVDSLILDKDRSIIMIVLGAAIGALGSYKAQEYFKKYLTNSNSNYKPGKDLEILGKLGIFVLETTTNVLVQLTSSLSATLATAVFSSADSLTWGLTGAVVSVVLLWLLQETIYQTMLMRKQKSES